TAPPPTSATAAPAPGTPDSATVLSYVREWLGMSEDADAASVLDSFKSEMAGDAELLALIKSTLKLPATADARSTIDAFKSYAVARAAVANSAAVVADLDAAKLEVADLRTKLADAEVETLMALHCDCIKPRDRDYFKNLYGRDQALAM